LYSSSGLSDCRPSGDRAAGRRALSAVGQGTIVLTIFGLTIAEFKDICLALSAIFVAGSAVYGVRQWKIELRGRARHELAIKAGVLALQFKQEFAVARGPYSSRDEAKDRIAELDESPGLAAVLDESHIRFKRLMRTSESLKALNRAGWEATVLGIDIENHIEELNRVYGSLYSDLLVFFEEKVRQVKQGPSAPLGLPHEELYELRTRIYHPGGDELSQQVDTAVNEIKSCLKKYI
jgi:hypothetical protein